MKSRATQLLLLLLVAAAMLTFIHEKHLLALPAALPLAALRSGAYQPRADEKVCLIICGANVDVATLT